MAPTDTAPAEDAGAPAKTAAKKAAPKKAAPKKAAKKSAPYSDIEDKIALVRNMTEAEIADTYNVGTLKELAAHAGASTDGNEAQLAARVKRLYAGDADLTYDAWIKKVKANMEAEEKVTFTIPPHPSYPPRFELIHQGITFFLAQEEEITVPKSIYDSVQEIMASINTGGSEQKLHSEIPTLAQPETVDDK